MTSGSPPRPSPELPEPKPDPTPSCRFAGKNLIGSAMLSLKSECFGVPTHRLPLTGRYIQFQIAAGSECMIDIGPDGMGHFASLYCQ